MTTTIRPKVPMDTMRKAALVAGVCYLLTFLGSIPALPLYNDILNDPGYILGDASNTGVLWGAIGELLCALTGIGTAVALYPIAKRHNVTSALGFVMSRTIEAAMIFVGVVSVLSIVTLQEAGTAGADGTSMVGVGHALAAMHDWTFLLGPGLMPAINAFLIGTVMYRTGLVPRILPKIGIVGGVTLLGSSAATLFGFFDQVSGWATLFALPIATWEFSFGIYMTFKGFKPAAIAALPAEATATDILVAV
jgi:hypothetical protein